MNDSAGRSEPAGALQGPASSQRPGADRHPLGELSALGASGDVAAAHDARGELLVERHDAVPLRDPQPEVVLGGVAVARVIAAQLEYHLAAEGGAAVGDRVEARQHGADVAGGKRGPGPQRPVAGVDLAHPRADHRHSRVGEDRQLSLQTARAPSSHRHPEPLPPGRQRRAVPRSASSRCRRFAPARSPAPAGPSRSPPPPRRPSRRLNRRRSRSTPGRARSAPGSRRSRAAQCPRCCRRR